MAATVVRADHTLFSLPNTFDWRRRRGSKRSISTRSIDRYPTCREARERPEGREPKIALAPADPHSLHFRAGPFAPGLVREDGSR